MYDENAHILNIKKPERGQTVIGITSKGIYRIYYFIAPRAVMAPLGNDFVNRSGPSPPLVIFNRVVFNRVLLVSGN